MQCSAKLTDRAGSRAGIIVAPLYLRTLWQYTNVVIIVVVVIIIIISSSSSSSSSSSRSSSSRSSIV